MKINFILILAMTLFACNKDSNSTTLSGEWKLIKYHNITDGTSETEPTDISRSIIMNFSDDGSIGKLDGNTVSNVIFGDYELNQDKGIKFLGLGRSEVGEPKWGNKFWDAISSTSTYERQGKKLFIFFNIDTEKMEFKKQ